ncbi:MAG: nucleotide disphospho-sugar-binding domain-containing protein [Leifsonia sp.]
MAEVMIAVMPFIGHVAPIVAVARAFLADGHAVRVYAGAAHAAPFADLGATVVTWSSAPDFDEHDLATTFPALRGRKGPRQMLANVEHVFIRTAAAQCADLLAAWADRPWDVIVADNLSLGAHLASERTGSPWVTVGIVPLSIPSRELPPPGLGIPPARGPVGRLRDVVLRRLVPLATRGMQAAYAEQRALCGLPRAPHGFDDAWYSPDLVCASGVPELEYPRTDLPRQVVFVGALTSPGPAAAPLPSWWPDLERSDASVVHVTQGTLNVDPHDLIEPAVRALGRQPVTVAIATGRAGADALPFPVPENARVAGMLPYAELLPLVDVMITNGGWGGVLAALSHGIPLVVAGGDLDKPEIAARVAWFGAGVDLGTGTPKPLAVLDAWRRVRTDPAFRANAERIGASLRSHDGPAEVVAHTVALLEGRRAGSASP